MTFRAWSEPIPKEDLPIPKKANWYLQLTPTPNRVFGENVLVAAGMSDQWAPDSKDIPVLKLGDQEVQLYQAAFATFGGVIWSRPLKAGEQYWYDQIKGYFMYPVADAFVDPPISTEGAHIPNPRPLRSVTSAGKEIVYLSSEESVGSSNGELSPWSQIFAGVLRDLGIDPEDKKKKPMKRKKVITLNPEARELGVVAQPLLLLTKVLLLRQKKGWSNPDAGTTPSSAAQEEGDEEEAEEEPAVKLIRKRSREAALGASVLSKPGGTPLIGKKSNLRSLYKFSPEAEKTTFEKKGVTITEPSEPTLKRPRVTKVTIKPFTVLQSEKEKQKAVEKAVKEREIERKRAAEKPPTGPKEPEVVATFSAKKAQGLGPTPITGLDQPTFEKGKGVEVEKPVETSPNDAPVQTVQVASAGETGLATKEQTVAAGFAAGQVGAGRPDATSHSPIGPMDTLGDVYYKSYTE
ncbi:hypothetical protein HanRHA438_Chr08g0350991 [Helianthus annuus]|nr:hypothetical protein HanRHA438_Chr08g0350991 [Helianthus annuus]